MRLWVGLGNPGAEYAHQRHNIGFMAVERIAARHRFGPWRRKFQGEVAEGTVAGQKVLLLKPATFMNESGAAVQAAAGFHKLPVEAVTIFHDELDLAPGKVRVKQGGGAAGHNGLRSTDAHVGNATWRVRLGIGHPGHKALVQRHVLGNFAKADAEWLDRLLDAVADAAPLLAEARPEDFMTRVALLTQTKE
jgi:PTH1 family peptidyl-tRNA hydrolase